MNDQSGTVNTNMSKHLHVLTEKLHACGEQVALDRECIMTQKLDYLREGISHCCKIIKYMIFSHGHLCVCGDLTALSLGLNAHNQYM